MVIVMMMLSGCRGCRENENKQTLWSRAWVSEWVPSDEVRVSQSVSGVVACHQVATGQFRFVVHSLHYKHVTMHFHAKYLVICLLAIYRCSWNTCPDTTLVRLGKWQDNVAVSCSHDFQRISSFCCKWKSANAIRFAKANNCLCSTRSVIKSTPFWCCLGAQSWTTSREGNQTKWQLSFAINYVTQIIVKVNYEEGLKWLIRLINKAKTTVLEYKFGQAPQSAFNLTFVHCFFYILVNKYGWLPNDCEGKSNYRSIHLALLWRRRWRWWLQCCDCVSIATSGQTTSFGLSLVHSLEV